MSRSRIITVILLAFSLCLTCPFLALAEQLEVLVPETDERLTIELGPTEAAELIIYLKSFGDLVSGFHVTILDDQDRGVGRNVSDMHGIVKFTNLPPGRFRIVVEKKWNERGGRATVSVGDIKIRKIPREN